jgi:hypothetical protein
MGTILVKLIFRFNDENKELLIESTNGWKEIRKYNENNKIIYRHSILLDKSIQKIEYKYDEVGNLISKVNTGEGYEYTIEHKYDAQNRRVSTIIKYPNDKVEYQYTYTNNMIYVKSSNYSSRFFKIDDNYELIVSDEDNYYNFYCKEGNLYRGEYGNLYFSNKSHIKIYMPNEYLPIPVIATQRESFLIDDHDLNKIYAHDEHSNFQSIVFARFYEYNSLFDEIDWNQYFV